ncbi:hypothetical protein F2Q68_00042246 [Brassica cretica]|uniref:Fe2OG dioxygenase domain-containing protein n=1 Tax=Brassica cretica TaxID=69181 RepID=A0A8S9MP26_BRACR|nr:hypothetical protein F2Q68_00042246 [Brassica cretica]
MMQLCSFTSMDSDSEVQKLNLACNEFEFFQLVNHGVDPSFLDKTKCEIQDFFNLPMEEKKRFWQQPNEMEGFGKAFVVSEDQKLDWADMFFFIVQPVELRKPHLFPKLPLPFRYIEMYSAQVKIQTMRMNYYPPCPEPHQVIGLPPHSDAVALTILLQVNEVEGLQIKKDAKWVSVKPLPNAFIVNVGDILEIITNGTYKSIEHRAVVNSEK